MRTSFEHRSPSIRSHSVGSLQPLITIAQMDEYVKSENIKKIKKSLANSNVLETMLSEGLIEPELLNRLLISAVQYDPEGILGPALDQDISSWGVLDPEYFKDPELENLVTLLLQRHRFDPGVVTNALIGASKYGRCDLITQILLVERENISEDTLFDALLNTIESGGWLKVVDLLLKEPIFRALPEERWAEVLRLSHTRGGVAIGSSLIRAIGPKLDGVKQFCTDEPSLLAFINECIGEIACLKAYHVQQPERKRRKLNEIQ